MLSQRSYKQIKATLAKNQQFERIPVDGITVISSFIDCQCLLFILVGSLFFTFIFALIHWKVNRSVLKMSSLHWTFMCKCMCRKAYKYKNQIIEYIWENYFRTWFSNKYIARYVFLPTFQFELDKISASEIFSICYIYYNWQLVSDSWEISIFLWQVR